MASAEKNLSDYKPTPMLIKEDAEIGIVVSEWNEEVTNSLAAGALKVLQENGIKADKIRIKYVPGTYELALGAQYMLEYTDVEAVLCLGCVIQGETKHFDFICNAAANAIAKVGLDYHVPVIFGVLTTDNQQQAIDRSGGKYGNKGDEAAITALKMISLENTLYTEDLVDISEN